MGLSKTQCSTQHAESGWDATRLCILLPAEVSAGTSPGLQCKSMGRWLEAWEWAGLVAPWGLRDPSCTQRKMRFGERRRPSKLKVPPKRMSIAGTWFLHTSISFCGLSILLNLVYTFSWGKNNWSLCNISFLSGRLYVGGSVGGKGVNNEGGCREKKWQLSP